MQVSRLRSWQTSDPTWEQVQPPQLNGYGLTIVYNVEMNILVVT